MGQLDSIVYQLCSHIINSIIVDGKIHSRDKHKSIIIPNNRESISKRANKFLK